MSIQPCRLEPKVVRDQRVVLRGKVLRTPSETAHASTPYDMDTPRLTTALDPIGARHLRGNRRQPSAKLSPKRDHLSGTARSNLGGDKLTCFPRHGKLRALLMGNWCRPLCPSRPSKYRLPGGEVYEIPLKYGQNPRSGCATKPRRGEEPSLMLELLSLTLCWVMFMRQPPVQKH